MESFLTVSDHRGIAKFLSFYRKYQEISSTSSGNSTDEIRRKQFIFFEDLYAFCHINSKDPLVNDLPIELRSKILREIVTWVYPDPSSPNFNESFSIIDKYNINISTKNNACPLQLQVIKEEAIAKTSLLDSSLEMLRKLALDDMFQHFTQIMSKFQRKAKKTARISNRFFKFEAAAQKNNEKTSKTTTTRLKLIRY